MSSSDLKTVIYLSQIYVCVGLKDSLVVMKSSIGTAGAQLPPLALRTQCLTNCRFRGTVTSSVELREIWELCVTRRSEMSGRHQAAMFLEAELHCKNVHLGSSRR